MAKVMLVCSKPSEEVEKCLRTAGGEIVTVNDGESAIFQAQHATFNMAVLVSTGKAMDLAETVFNLRDISATMPIIIIADRHGARESPADIIAHASPNTRALTLDGLAAYLGISGAIPTRATPRRSIGKRH
ncbi:MAG: hypothetical protein WD688_22840 [Candidatus Binatia bacterium]